MALAGGLHHQIGTDGDKGSHQLGRVLRLLQCRRSRLRNGKDRLRYRDRAGQTRYLQIRQSNRQIKVL